MNRRHSYYSF